MAVTISLEKLLEAGAHFGHQYKRWNPKMRPFMYAVKDKIFVFDLLRTRDEMQKALDVITNASRAGKSILFVGTKKQVKEKLKEISEATNQHYIVERWPGGLLTNFQQVRRSLDNLTELEKKVADGKKLGYTKKELLLMSRKIAKLHNSFGGILTLKEKPGLIVIIDTHKERGAVFESRREGVETVGVVDSNANPEDVNWAIPMNDDATKALDYVLDLMKEAVLEGKNEKPVKAPVKEAKEKTEKTKKKTKKSDKA
jgi:small subunit ribosomal protein S2